MREPFIRPFLKWPGNKFRCITHIIDNLPNAKRLIEPFTGSGAVFLNTPYEEYLLAEKNLHLVNLYHHLQQEGESFIEYCQQWFTPRNNNKERYYQLRERFNASKNSRLKSALFIYLNRHGFNGLCRYNQKGQYNVPFGTYNKPYFPKREMLAFLEKTTQAQFVYQDFQETFMQAKPGDVIYCDPPYYPLSKTASFTAYNHHGFKDTEQVRLAQLAIEASQKGCHVLISNHDTIFTRLHYQKANHIISLEVPRTISCIGTKRQSVTEILAYFKAQ